MNRLQIFNFLFLAIECVHSQYASIPQQALPSGNICTNKNNTASVENFFNLIFSEFHSHPPVCVCIQMCAEQPTYCYPNGCFKKDIRANLKKKQNLPAQVSQVQTNNLKPMSFLVNSQSDFMENLLSNKLVSELKPFGSKYETQSTDNEIHRDPFKDRYQSIFKYRKEPKLHLRYNLREQVKNKKSYVLKIQKIDVSKTKWPATAKKQFFIDNQNRSHDNSHFFPSLVLDNGPIQYQSKFFKRDLTQKFTHKELLEKIKNTNENTSFSLENLIENLIEHSFGPLANDTELNLNANVDYALKNNVTTSEPITHKNMFDNNSVARSFINETTNVVSMNMSNENIDVNKYTDDFGNEMYNNVFKDMIESLSRHIDKNNNSSVEMMEQVLGHRVTVTTQQTKPTIGENLQINIMKKKSDIEELVKSLPQITTESVQMEKEPERKEAKKKSHQRFTRKMQIGKNN